MRLCMLHLDLYSATMNYAKLNKQEIKREPDVKLNSPLFQSNTS